MHFREMSRAEEAETNFQQAIAMQESAGARLELAITRLEYGNLLNFLGEFHQAAMLFEQARDYFDEQGVRLHLKRAEKELVLLQAR